MEKKELVNIQTGEIMAVTPPEKLDDAAISALVAQTIGTEMNIFQTSTIEQGTGDTPLKALAKLETDDVLRQVLHIGMIHISRATSADGEIVDKSDYPVMTFEEYPGCRYSGGKRLMQIVTTWAIALGDDIHVVDKGEKKGFVFEGDRMLPALNSYISAGNHPAILMKKDAGKQYVDVFVLGI